MSLHHSVLLLSQEVSNGHIAVVVAISSIISGAVGSAATWYVNYKKSQKAEQRAEDDRIIKHLELALDRVQKECDRLRAEQIEFQEVLANLRGHRKYLEALLKSKNIKFQSFRSVEDEDHGDSETARRSTPPEGYPRVN